MLEKIDHGSIRELRMARPPVNALSPGMVSALDAALEDAAGNARAIVLSGQPGMFSAGLDLKALLALGHDDMLDFWDRFFGLLRRLGTSPVPVVAAITGHSPAGGAVMSLFCDRRVAAAGEFKIGLNEVQVGMSMPPVIHAGLARLVGTRHAETLCVTGALLGPDDALRVGLVDEVVPVEEVVPRAVAWCGALLKLPPHAISSTRALCRADMVALFDSLGDDDRERINAGWFSEETRGTMLAVLAQLAAKTGRDA